MSFDPFGDFQTRGYLRNSLNIRDLRAMERAEHLAFRAHVPQALQALASRETLSYDDVVSTHQRLFGCLYPWAGQDRLAVLPDQAVGKGDDFELFALPLEIQRAISYALELGQDSGVLLERPGEVLGYLAFGHPFLEGNGRCLMTVHADLLRRAAVHVDWSPIGARAYLDALTQELRDPGRGHLDALLRLHLKAGALEVSGTDCESPLTAPASTATHAQIEPALAASMDVACCAEHLVRELKVAVARSPLDAWADHVSRLSDAEAVLDDTEEQLLALVRVQALTPAQALRLQLMHFERRQQHVQAD